MERSGGGRRNGRRNWNGRHQEEGRKKNERRGGSRNHEGRQHNKQPRRPETRLPQQVHEDMQRDLESIKELKQREVVCPKCGKPIDDIAAAFADKTSGQPVHFDCVLEELQGREELKENERVTYIGQGRFAVVHFPNPHDTRKFTIEKIIEWEEKEKKFDWRQEIAGMYSQVH